MVDGDTTCLVQRTPIILADFLELSFVQLSALLEASCGVSARQR